jgi:hypothetical protein
MDAGHRNEAPVPFHQPGDAVASLRNGVPQHYATATPLDNELGPDMTIGERNGLRHTNGVAIVEPARSALEIRTAAPTPVKGMLVIRFGQ